MSAYIILRIVSVSLIFAGLVFAGISVGIGHSAKKKRISCTCKTVGKVVEIEKTMTSSHSGTVPMTSWYPVFEYSAGGHVIRKRSSYGGAKQAFYKGQTITVYYNPENYNEYYVREESVTLLRTIFIVVGIILIIAGVAVSVIWSMV